MSKDVFQQPDDAVRAQIRAMLAEAQFAALAVIRPGAGMPSVSRIALALGPEGRPVSLISSLAPHTAALEACADCALLVGEPGAKGDPLTHPRLTLHARAELVARGTGTHEALRSTYLAQRPKAGLYADFADFRFVRFHVTDGLLNGGFGRAYLVQAADLQP